MIELAGLDPERDAPALQLAALVIVGGVGDATSEWLAGRLPVTRDELIAGCARLCVAAVAD